LRKTFALGLRKRILLACAMGNARTAHACGLTRTFYWFWLSNASLEFQDRLVSLLTDFKIIPAAVQYAWGQETVTAEILNALFNELKVDHNDRNNYSDLQVVYLIQVKLFNVTWLYAGATAATQPEDLGFTGWRQRGSLQERLSTENHDEVLRKRGLRTSGYLSVH
jgi:hypothetical protein